MVSIVGTHAPHAGDDGQIKDKYYEQLQRIRDENKSANHINYMLGDFNAQIVQTINKESDLIGTHIFNCDDKTINDLSEDQRDNRQRFIHYIFQNSYVVSSTYFEKDASQQITYRTPGTPDFHQEVTDANHAQIDFAMVTEPWRNTINDITVKEATAFHSDHELIKCKIRIRWAIKQKTENRTRKRYRKPDEQQKQDYNKYLDMILHENGEPHELSYEQWASPMLKAAQYNLSEIPPEQNNKKKRLYFANGLEFNATKNRGEGESRYCQGYGTYKTNQRTSTTR